MFTMPDFREKQILFVQPGEGNAYRLRIKNQNIAYEEDGKVVNQTASSRVLSVFVIGDLSFTSVLLRKCMEQGVSICFLKRNLEAYALVGAAAEGNTLLRAKQYGKTSGDELRIAKHIIKNKTANQFALLRNMKSNDISENTKTSNESLAWWLEKIDNAKDAQSLLGIEGDLGKRFFQTYFAELGWRRRIPRGKTDPDNILLDIGYTLLFNYIDALLRLFGFDTYRGVYHKLFFQRKSLSCDIEEPFRCLIDKKLLKMHHLGQVRDADFAYNKKTRQYYLKYEQSTRYATLFTEAILERKEEIFRYVRAFYYATLNETEEFPYFDVTHS